MATTRAPRRRQDAALAAYLQVMARAIKEERTPTAQAAICKEMKLDPAQFTQALAGKTGSHAVLFAFAKYRGTTAEEIKERAETWYRAHRLEIAAREAFARVEGPEELEELCRRLRAIARDRQTPGSGSSPTGAAEG